VAPFLKMNTLRFVATRAEPDAPAIAASILSPGSKASLIACRACRAQLLERSHWSFLPRLPRHADDP
jgi:hypothetical protein